MIVSNLSKLFPVIFEEEKPDHGEWDTIVV